MSFRLFKQKEVINNKEKNENNDIVEDFGNYINNNIVSTNDLNLSSFENNFQEEVDENVYPDSYMNEINDTNNFVSYNDEIIVDTNTNVFNNDTENSLENNINDSEQNGESNYTNTLNVNNYDYNPIIDNLENATTNIENSEDINVAMSNLYNTNKKINEDEKIQEQINNRYYENVNNNELIPSIQITQSNNLNYERKEIPNPNIVESSIGEYNDVDPGYKKCPKCGQKMREDYKQCFVCGTMF